MHSFPATITHAPDQIPKAIVSFEKEANERIPN
jgi:hypothetical protein